MSLLCLSFRNLGRYKRRTLLTAMVIAVSLSIYLFIHSLILGLEETSYNNIINLETGHLQLLTRDYERERLPLVNLINIDHELLDELESIDGSYALRLKAMTSLITYKHELPVMAIGIEIQREREVFTTWEYLVEGGPLQEKNHVVMGRSLGYLMELEVGDDVTLLFRTREGPYNTLDAVVKGFLHTPHPFINDATIYLPLESLQEVLRVSHEVSEIIIGLRDEKNLIEQAEDLEERFKEQGLIVYTWREAAHMVQTIIQAGRAENRIILSILLLISGVGIMNTVILSTLERKKEIGMMKALGMREGEILLSLMLESFMIGILGGILGCLLGLIGVYLLTSTGLDMAWFGVGDGDFTLQEKIGLPARGRLYGAWSLSSFLLLFLFASITSLLASILPAYGAVRKDPIETLFHQ